MRVHSRWTIPLLAALAAGCQQPGLGPTAGTVVGAPEDTVSVHRLAGRLGLQVIRTTDTYVILRNRANTVLVFFDPGGRAFVNGQAVGPVGGMVRSEGILFVPSGVEGDVRAALRPVVEEDPPPFPPPAPPPPAPPPPTKTYRVVIDPGHGGRDPGAISCLGFHEKTINLAVARQVVDRLRQPAVGVSLTRDQDVFVELDDRASIANRMGAHLFVSIHADSCQNPSARGFTVYVSRNPTRRSRAAARAIARALAGTGMASRGVREANFRVLVGTRCPAVLVELGYLSNTQDAALLARPSFRRQLAYAIAKGACEFLAGR